MTPTDSPATITVYELRFDNEEYYVPLGLFDTRGEATTAWELLTPKLNDEYTASYTVEPVTLHHAPPDSDVTDGWLSLLLDHNEDVKAFDPDPDDLDKEDETYHSLEPSPGQAELPLT